MDSSESGASASDEGTRMGCLDGQSSCTVMASTWIGSPLERKTKKGVSVVMMVLCYRWTAGERTVGDELFILSL